MTKTNRNTDDARGRVTRAAVETLESRQMLSVSLNAAGWTQITPEAGRAAVYVSSSTGSDFNSGLAEFAPVKSIEKAITLLRNGAGDHMLLKRGDVWRETLGYWKISGKDAQNPTVIGAYGTGERPTLMTGTGYAFTAGTRSAGGLHDVAVMGIRFYSDGHDPKSPTFVDSAKPDGFAVSGGVTNLLIENCSIEKYTFNMTFLDYLGPTQNIQVRRSAIVDAYSDVGYSQGLYSEGVNGILLEGNTFDHNGWMEGKSGAGATIFNHGAYVHSSNKSLVARGNIFSNSSSHGLQARSGGIVQDNLFLNNPIGMSFGLVNGGGPPTAGGVVGKVSGNVFVGGRHIGTEARGIGMEVSNIRPNAGVSIDNNLFKDVYSGAQFAAINVGIGRGTFENDQVGVNHLTIANNIVDNWSHGLFLQAQLRPGSTGKTALTGLVVKDNEFADIWKGYTIYHGFAQSPAHETWTNNNLAAGAGWIDPNRTMLTYDQSVGGNGSLAHFLSVARSVPNNASFTQYSGVGAVGYLKAGYRAVADPTPVTTPAARLPAVRAAPAVDGAVAPAGRAAVLPADPHPDDADPNSDPHAYWRRHGRNRWRHHEPGRRRHGRRHRRRDGWDWRRYGWHRRRDGRHGRRCQHADRRQRPPWLRQHRRRRHHR